MEQENGKEKYKSYDGNRVPEPDSKDSKGSGNAGKAESGGRGTCTEEVYTSSSKSPATQTSDAVCTATTNPEGLAGTRANAERIYGSAGKHPRQE